MIVTAHVLRYYHETRILHFSTQFMPHYSISHHWQSAV